MTIATKVSLARVKTEVWVKNSSAASTQGNRRQQRVHACGRVCERERTAFEGWLVFAAAACLTLAPTEAAAGIRRGGTGDMQPIYALRTPFFFSGHSVDVQFLRDLPLESSPLRTQRTEPSLALEGWERERERAGATLLPITLPKEREQERVRLASAVPVERERERVDRWTICPV